MRSTVSHIAKEAGVSPATVDRVLNGREGVRARTRDIVMDVATRLGYFGPVASEARQEIRMEFLLPAGNNTLMLMLRKFLFMKLAKLLFRGRLLPMPMTLIPVKMLLPK